MQAPWNTFSSPVRSFAAGMSRALAALLALCFGSLPAFASAPPPIVLSHAITLGYFPAGGWDSGQSPLSGSFVVAPNGHVYIGIEWGGGILDIATDGTTSKPFDLSGQYTWNGGPTAIDSYGNLYVTADGYDPNIYKIPYSPTTGTYPGMTSAPSAVCQGGTSDTAPCLFATKFSSTVFTNGSGFASLIFDHTGNFFIATSANPTDNKNSIYECNASCQTGSGAPTLLYADAKTMGAIAIDPWGNIYFSDGDNSAGSGVTNLKELVYSSGSYASTPTTIESYTNAAGYGNGFSGVAVDTSGTIYFATNADGIFAIPSTQSGGPNVAGMYKVGSGGGYGITLDPRGNVYLVHYTSSQPAGDANYAVDEYAMNRLALGQTTIGGTAKILSATIYDTAGACTPTLTLNSMQGGVATTEFAATSGSGCSAELGTSNGTLSPAVSLTGAELSVTVTFNPAQAGVRTALLEIGDSAAGASGAATLAGSGLGPWASLDPGSWNSATTGLSGPTVIVGDTSGGVVLADQSGGKLYYIAAGSGSPTLTAFGSGFTAPNGLAFDPNSNLYVSDPALGIVKIANAGTNGFVPGAQTNLLPPTSLFDGTALGSQPAGIAIGSGGNMFIVDQQNGRVVSYSYLNGTTGATLLNTANGLVAPAGIAVDSVNGYVCVADSSAGKIFLLNGGVVSSITVPGVTKPTGVATDNSGSLLVTDAVTKTIVYVPWSSSSFDTSTAFVIETLPATPDQLTIKDNGNLFFASKSGKAVYAIYREQGAVDLGPVQNGVTNSAAVYLTNSGNTAVTLGTPFITQPTNTMFTLVPASQNGCTDGGTGNPGQSCAMTSTFAPLVGTPDQTPESGTATLSFGSAGSTTVNMSGVAILSAIQAQTITNFNPPPTMLAGQQALLSATGGGSGNPVTFSIDAASACSACATVSGNTLIALKVGTVTVDADQAAGVNNGTQYAAAQTVKVNVTINAATAAGVPALVMSQVNWYGILTGGGFTDGQNPAGGSFAVNSKGDVIAGNTYGNTVYFFSGANGGAQSTLASVNGPGGITVDSHDNLYVAHLYNQYVLKVPYANGTYALTDTTPSACTGSDTAECTFANAGSNNKITATTFDAAGKFYMVTEPGTGGANSIYVCDSSCQPSGTGTLVYTDAAKYAISSVAVDPWGNIFFTDSWYPTDLTDSNSSASYLKEITYSSTSGYAASPVTLQTLTIASPANYDNQLDGVAVGSDGTVYYATQSGGGIFGVPNTQSGGPDMTHQYKVAGQGGKAIELGPNGQFYVASYATVGGKSGDAIGQVAVNALTAPTAQYQGAPVTTTATVIDNVVPCSTAATISFTSTDSQFSATSGTACSSVSASFSAPDASSSYTATITFQATQRGVQTATLTASDTTNGGIGTATITGISKSTPQTITFTAPTTTTFTYQPGLTIAIAATGGGSNNPIVFTIDASSTGKGSISNGTLTVTQAGNIIIDANQAGGVVNGTAYDDAPQAQLTIVINKAPETITFTPPSSPQTYAPGLTVALSATGSGSTSPIVFTVDSGSATTGAGTISGNVLTVTQAGTIILDANQVADVNYQAAAQVQHVLVVNQATQAITITPVTTPFHYIASCSTIVLCAQVQIVAAGGATNNAVALSPDSTNTVQFSILNSSTTNGTTTSTVALIPNQTLPFPAKLVIDANQQGNANYSAAKQAQITINVLAPLPLQTITWANPGTQVTGSPLTLNGTSSAGANFPVAYTSWTSSVCTVSNSTATFLTSGTCTITAIQPGDNTTFAAAIPVTNTFYVNASGKTPGLGLNLSLSSLTMSPGSVGLTQLTVTSSNNFQGSITLACSGLPSGYNCAFNSNPLVLAMDPSTGLPQSTSISANLSISGGSSASNSHQDPRPFLPMTTLAVALCFLGFRKRNRLHLLLLAVVALFGFGLFTACGGSSSTIKTKTTTSTVTVTATSGTTKSSTNLTVIVQ